MRTHATRFTAEETPKQMRKKTLCSLYEWYYVPKMNIRTSLCASLFALLVGCSMESPVEPISSREGRSVAWSLGTSGTVLSFDEEMLRIAGDAPGFAGFFVNEQGEFVVSVKTGADAHGVLGAVDRFRARKARGQVILPTKDLPGVRVREVAHGFADLHGFFVRALPLLSQLTVTQIDIDEVLNRVVVGVRDEGSRSATLSAVRQMGIDGGVAVEVVGPSVALSNLQGSVRPVPSGVQINRSVGNLNACTLSYNAYYRDDEGAYDGERYFITASHCTDTTGLNTGNVFGQPDVTSPIGVEVADPAFFPGRSSSQVCSSGMYCRYSDAVLLRWYKDEVGLSPWRFGEFPTVGTSSPFTITGYKHVLYNTPGWDPSMEELYVGLAIEKLGRTTGRTTGTIAHTCVTTRVYIDLPSQPTSRWLLCQFQATGLASSGGDSGAPVYRRDVDGHMNPALGILWGKSYVNNDVAYNGIRTTFSWLYLAVAELSAEMGGGWLEYIRPMWGVPGYW